MTDATADTPRQDRHTVSYTLLRSDLEAYFRRVLHTKEAKRKLIRSLASTVLLTVIIALFLGLRTFDSTTSRLAFAGFCVLFVGVIVHAAIHSWRTAPSRTIDFMIKGSSERAVFGSVRLTISPEGVCEEKEFLTQSYRWAGIESIERVDLQVLLKTGTHSAFVIPERAFKNDTERDSFVESARVWRQEHGSLQTACPQCGYNLDRLSREGCPECGWRREPVPTTRT
jgi:hypothetical protein